SGTVMGGGVGLSAHARHRIATETTRLAMPEARIGLIPDVGGTWLLSRAPGETGTYVGLTSAHVDGADAIYMGFAEHFVPQASLAALLDALVEEAPPDDAAIRTVIARFAGSPGIAPLTQYAPLIDRTFAHDTVEEILDALHRDGSAFALSTERQIGANSPTSLKLTLRALREARRLTSLGDCIKLEFRVMNRTLSGHDLYEGARAVIIEKDRSPKWQPSDLADVSPHVLDHYFAPLADGELQL
ncbi:MAG: enoyl-CoA hydratase/isomerase family protein, partial [Candidatus Eremiobacteraeota bacterium]|nr:enoyl-CoA hydratase/isomerase family protein [Candidatus Eremiobacteraeota bacterium]